MFAPLAPPPDILAIYRRQIATPGAATAMLNWYRAMRLRASNLPGLDRPIETRTLLIWGDDDVALDPVCLDGTERHVRDLTLHRLPGVSHWVQQHAPDTVNQLLRGFLAVRP